jgi:hypothetical protein
MKPYSPQLFNIWENPERPVMAWHAQMVNYVAHFNTREEAERFVASVQASRAAEKRTVK